VSDVRLQWRTHFRVDSITAGVLLALIRVHWPAHFERLHRSRRLLLGVLGVGFVHLLTVGKQGALGTTIGFTVAYLTAAALLLLVYRAAWVTRARFFSVPMAMLGRYSYGVYIWHIFAAHVALSLLPGVAPTGALAQVVMYAAAIAVGVLATVAVEKPVLRLRDRLLPAKDHAPSERPMDDDAAPVPVRSTWAPPPVPITLPVRSDPLVRVAA
jgi:peptidoglycan/LPS O-acetylase OafA/YrhL